MKNLGKSYKEINIILNLLGTEFSNKVPKSMREFFINYQDDIYNPNITLEDVFNRNILPETMSLITALYINYWTENEEEKENFMSIIRKYDEEKKEKMYNIFGTQNNTSNK